MVSASAYVLVSVAFALLQSLVSGTYYHNHVHKPVYEPVYKPAPVCKAEDVRCIGAPGKPSVEYGVGCCSGMSCTKPDPSYDGYGFVCEKENAPKAPTYPAKCYADGQRCIGAPGKPAVDYLGCCKGSCTKTKEHDWGLFCEDEPSKSITKPSPKPSPKKCYASGDRCIGAPGKPAVDYLGCCTGSCTKTKEHDWGLFCEDEPSKPITKPSPKPSPTKCYAAGDRCIGAPGKPAVDYLGCCTGSCSKTKEHDWGLFCEDDPSKPSTKPSPKPSPMKCYGPGDRCIGAPGKPAVDYLGCCKGSCSVTKKGDWGVFCSGGESYPIVYPSSSPTPSPKPVYESPPPKCIKAGGSCKYYGTPCCKGSKCTASYKSYGVFYTCAMVPMDSPEPYGKY